LANDANQGDRANAVAPLWARARPPTLARIATLEAAVAALRDAALDPDRAAVALDQAHMLAGALGTFGMPEGTERARTIESRLRAGAAPADAPALAREVAALRAIAEAGPRS
jgi:HPt (histidine-containing phosphotransfer) domain-containing protein